MGVAVENSKVDLAAYNISFMTLKHPFTYLGVKVGGRMTRINSWDEIINKNPLSALEVEDEDSLYWWKAIKTIHGEDDKTISVAAKMAHHSLCSSLRRSRGGGLEQEQLADLLLNVEGLILPNTLDRWSWTLSGSGEFSVSSIRNLIDDQILEEIAFKSR
ncbi:hypothetical protein Tco_0823738 [Tanacetum coccineum]|uniref:Uncharacterized protein n=1 Tax=Tanacetum coccineum TaxID=301880 RepID=A0ABQ5AKI8_9ASTR